MDSLTINGVEFRRFNHLYWVSACGKVLRNAEPVQLRRTMKGYFVVGRQQYVHRLVAECWCHKPEGATDVHHINHDRQDNRAENLEWLTRSQHTLRHPEFSRAPMSEAGKQRLREYRRGTKASEETKQKQREATLRLGLRPPPRPVGTKLGEASRAKCRENNANNASCVVFGVHYRSFSEAGRALGIRCHTLRKRCLSDNFPDYRLGERSI